MRESILKFRESEFGQQFRKATATAKRPNGCIGGRKQLGFARCPCIKDRKPSECACEQCTFISINLSRLHVICTTHRTRKQYAG